MKWKSTLRQWPIALRRCLNPESRDLLLRELKLGKKFAARGNPIKNIVTKIFATLTGLSFLFVVFVTWSIHFKQ